MTTLKEFNEVINQSIKLLEPPKNVLVSEKYDCAAESIEFVIGLLKNLQLPRPTCSTCDHMTDERNRVQEYCSRIMWKIPFEVSRFGCNQHSDYGATK